VLLVGLYYNTVPGNLFDLFDILHLTLQLSFSLHLMLIVLTLKSLKCPLSWCT